MIKLIMKAVDEGKEDDLVKAGLKVKKLSNNPKEELNR